jgi:transposase
LSLGFEDPLASVGVTGTPTDDTTLRLTLTAARAENLVLRSRVAALEQRNEYLRNRLRLYENWNTPPSKEGGAGASPDGDHSTDQDEPNTGDDNSSDDDSTSGDSEQTQGDDAGGDADAASDSEDSSPGRDPGHEGTTRPPPDPDRTIWVDEAYCPECECFLTDPDSYTAQTVIDTPHPVPVTVTEYKLATHHCSCGSKVTATHEDCPAVGRFGPKVLAQTALRRLYGRLPNRKQTDFFEWLFDQPISHRTVYNLTKRVADQLRPAYEEVKENVRESDVIYVDETAFPVDGDRHWVWTFVTDDEVLYKFDESRGSQVLEAVLGEDFAEDATLSCDGWSAYSTYHPKLQRCWAHLLREAEFLAKRYREAKPLSDELHELHDELTTFDEGDPSASSRKQKREDAMLHLEGLTRQEYEYEEVQKLITKIRNGLGHWLTFVTEPDVDSTNNRAERALREQVMLRKMFRTLQSDEGVYIHETITTMLATWKLRGLDPPEQLQSALGGRDLSLP